MLNNLLVQINFNCITLHTTSCDHDSVTNDASRVASEGVMDFHPQRFFFDFDDLLVEFGAIVFLCDGF